MNEKQFLKKLNSKANRDGSFTIFYVNQLIEDQSKAIVKKPTISLFQRLFGRRQVKSVEQIISDNFQTIIEKLPNEYIVAFLESLAETEELNEVIQSNFGLILERLNNSDERISSAIYQYMRLSEENEEFLKQNAEMIIDKLEDKDLFDVIQILKKIDPEEIEFFNEKLEEKKLEISGALLSNAVCYRLGEDVAKKEAKGYSKTLLMMIEELLETEDKRWIDIDNIGQGTYSNVFSIGNKVIKIGAPRATYHIPNHRRILQPLIRTNLLDKDEKKEVACIEISEKIEKGNATAEELYELYKALRDSGIIWTDIRSVNVGRLTKTNDAYLNGEKIDVAPNSVGFDHEVQDEPLEKGELVILDSDHIYHEEEFNGDLLYAKEFEKKYQNERQEKVIEEHKRRSIEARSNQGKITDTERER